MLPEIIVVVGILMANPISAPQDGVPQATPVLLQESGAAGKQAEQRQIIVHSVEGVGSEEVVTGVPYTATAVIDSTQLLADGNRIENHRTERLARDGAGRTRRELQISTLGGLQVVGPSVVLIDDPVSQSEYTLDPSQHTARATKIKTISLPAGPEPPHAAADAGRRQVVRENLGTQTIEGFLAEGTRVTSKIPAGLLGNQQPLSISVEIWFAPELRAVVLRKRSDPRSGESTYRLTDIRRAEADPSLFKIPPDFKVTTGNNPDTGR